MMLTSSQQALPSVDVLATLPLDQLQAHYRVLRDAPVDASEAAWTDWLARWSRLEDALGDAGTWLNIRYTRDTRDVAAKAAHLRWVDTIDPGLAALRNAVQSRWLAEGRAIPVPLTEARIHLLEDVGRFRAENVVTEAALDTLAVAYQETMGAITVPWEGASHTLEVMGLVQEDTDRARREAAFRASTTAVLAHRDHLASIFDAMWHHRQQLAPAAGLPSFEAYMFSAYHRTGAYTPADAAAFGAAIEAVFVPLYAERLARRRQRLGVPTLRPWDLAVDPAGRAPLRPFTAGQDLADGVERIMGALDPDLAAVVRQLRDTNALDLDNRPGKAAGGYCTTLAQPGHAYIHMNAVGATDDVVTLLHETGHAAHAAWAAHWPWPLARALPMEMAEVASMSLELLSRPHWAAPVGFYSPRDAARARLDHLEGILLTLPHVAAVDGFQRWLYQQPACPTPAERDAAWCALRARFEPGVDWAGLTAERAVRWWTQLHIWEVPFYYIEYGLAQIGALQVWANARRDPASALRQYKTALALGGTQGLPALYAAAGVRFAWDEATLRPLADALRAAFAEADAEDDAHA